MLEAVVGFLDDWAVWPGPKFATDYLMTMFENVIDIRHHVMLHHFEDRQRPSVQLGEICRADIEPVRVERDQSCEDVRIGNGHGWCA